MERLRAVDWVAVRRDCFNIFTKLIRTKSCEPDSAEIPAVKKQRLTRCLTTLDLTSLGVGSCVGTGMYLVAGMVAKKFAGPGVVISFIIAALASIFSGACYAEFGVRVPHTTGSAYMYSYVTVGEFIAFIIGWNMVLEYLIGTSACARALSACFDSLVNGALTRQLANSVGTMYGKPPDFLAFGITLLMTVLMVAGVKKSLMFNNILNAINLCIWVFFMTAGLFYVDTDNWTQHDGFLPYGWSGVFSGAATCFYAFIGFDIIATTGEEAHNPKRSIPLAIVLSLGIILCAYVTTSTMLTLIVPYEEVSTDSALVQMFGHVHAPTCKCIVAVGALAGLTVSMFGSMFPMPRVIYAMALDGLVFKQLSGLWERTGTPALATVGGGVAAALVALLIQLEVLVEMMSIGTLLAYTLVSTCVLVLRYQPHSTNLIELLPQSLRTPIGDQPTAETTFSGFQGEVGRTQTHLLSANQQRVMVRRVTRSSPDSDDTMPGDEEGEMFGRDDAFLVSDRAENKFYGTVPGGSSGGSGSACARMLDACCQRLQYFSYLCPGYFPWVDNGPATDSSGLFVIKSVGAMYVLVIFFDLFAAYGSPGTSTFTVFMMTVLFLAILSVLLMISRKPQNRNALMYMTPGLPFVPGVAILVNIYLILNLSVLTLVRFTFWMILGMVMYFKYGIKHSLLENSSVVVALSTPERSGAGAGAAGTALPTPAGSPRPQPPARDTNIFQGDMGPNMGLYGNSGYSDPLLAWHDTETHVADKKSSTNVQLEQRFDQQSNQGTSHTSSRPPWATPDPLYANWND